MCIDDNIPADNYCGIILKAEQQEDTDIYGNVKWRRIYLWIDVAKGLYQGYFTRNYLKWGKQEWQGVMSIYLPNSDDCSAPDDTKKYQQYMQNLQVLQQYNQLDSLSGGFVGLLIPIQVYNDDVGAIRVKNYCLSSNYQIDPTFADTDLSHYAQVDDIQYYSPHTNLSNAITPTVVNNECISPARNIAARRKHRTQIVTPTANIPMTVASPQPPPLIITEPVSAEEAVNTLVSMYSNDCLIDLYKRYLAENFLPHDLQRQTNSLNTLYQRLNEESREICFTSITSLCSCDIKNYDNPICNQHDYDRYINFADTVTRLIGNPIGQYCRLYKYLSAYYYRYFSNYNFSVVTDKYTDNLADLTNDDKSERYNLQKQFRVKMYSVIYPNSAINPLWIVDDIPANEYIKNRYGLALDMDTNKIRFRVEEEVFGMKGYVGVDIKTGLSMYRSTKNDR